MEVIEDRLCAALCLEDHQRVSAVHQNTDNWHLHVAINRIHPVTFHAIHPHRDHYRLQAGCAELEIEFGLTKTAHSRDAAEAARNSQRGPVVPKPADPALSNLQAERGRARLAREAAMKALRIRQAEYARQLAAYHAERLRQEKLLAMRGHLRRDGYQHLAERRRIDRAERIAREIEERRILLAEHPISSQSSAQQRTASGQSAGVQESSQVRRAARLRPQPERGAEIER